MSTVRAIRIADLPSTSCRGDAPAEAATMTASEWSVKEFAQDRLKAGVRSDDDAKREVQRAARTDQRSRQLQVCARVDEHPRVLVTEPEAAELLEAPAHDALILERVLVGRWVLRCRHTF